ncbi:MAG: thioredoxin domain-containing protein [Candidatus Rokubacteria bacterium]|nr:thioredoxin domain-containing protein [Candidatus Rokubacteria bacterium]
MRQPRVQPTVILWALALLTAGLPIVTPAQSEPLAEVDGEVITAEEVEKALAGQLRKLEEQIHILKRQKVEALIGQRLLAREATQRGISVAALLDAEVTSKVGLVTEQEIDAFYRTNKARFRADEAAAREQIRALLQNQKLATHREAFVQSLRSKANVVVHLKAPPVFRAEVSVEGAPVKGSATAPVTIVKFEDFHCPFCKGVQPTLTELLSRYGEKVRLVHRDFPIDQLHPAARKAHEAARCANDQRRFWPYHDTLYVNAPKASPEQLRAYAQEVGLDLPAFGECLTSGKHQAAVQKDVDEGIRLGVTGTPSFFINGQMVVGAQPLESFVRVIENELARGR